ncbi:16S rRNA (uracil(1498)-N(3))-methyltransferase [Mycoplasmopsis verecunda]|uniref:Ribosomal RNA small subunit methyltransferase E n=1 Tax=Mycoplasmopsis verecunda TaxID=171291 RepID=A0A1T4LYU5_9BACT|nr:16S rRNA (uracil(1498)-N(3))-methyltransferase [Mycoplasmopsis verecunda]WPB54466.1 16S rRNA (uracil(1498)-N(3))-methyltransferase [Mycoplasmopsis verecunda]SJZ59816.1 16S rRNA (uracil1498-N3)-methyltransferase [Mycoplasmopsis verecunda]
MNRFFVNEKVNNYFILDKDTLKHLKVIRANDKEFICVYNNEFYKCILQDDKALIIEKINQNHELNIEVVLAISVIKWERFEWALQKATELGVSKIIPIITQYTQHDLVRFNKFDAKLDRLKSIVKSAAEQSFRNNIPEISPLTKFKDVLKYNIENKFIAHEQITTSVSLPQPINENVLFIVGPEGGFSQEEILLATENNVSAVSLGSRILRAETAAIYLLSQIKIQ